MVVKLKAIVEPVHSGRKDDELHNEDVLPEEQSMPMHRNHFDEIDTKSNKPVQYWYCENCTTVDLFEVLCCKICGESRDSDVLSSLSEEARENRFQFEGLEPCRTVVGYDDRMLKHYEVDKELHPHFERPDRLKAISITLKESGIFPGLCFSVPARRISDGELRKVHSEEQIAAVECTSSKRKSLLDSDTYANEHTSLVAQIAAGLCSDLATAIYKGQAKNGFALVRPPGHHAGVSTSSGFCIHNNAAIAAASAKAAGAKKILILDWDVHHGNGTQEIFSADKTVLYVSLHRYDDGDFYPRTGAANMVGVDPARGYSVNIPWDYEKVGDRDYLYAFRMIVLPIAIEFAPELIIISAGFDAARGDPIGFCDVTPACYAEMTRMLTSLSDGKLLVILEGGYNLRSIARSSKAVVEVLLGGGMKLEADNLEPSTLGLQTVTKVLKIQKRYWSSLKKHEMPRTSCKENKGKSPTTNIGDDEKGQSSKMLTRSGARKK